MSDIFHLVNIDGVSTMWHFTGEGKQYSSYSHGTYSLVAAIINQVITLKIDIASITLFLRRWDLFNNIHSHFPRVTTIPGSEKCLLVPQPPFHHLKDQSQALFFSCTDCFSTSWTSFLILVVLLSSWLALKNLTGHSDKYLLGKEFTIIFHHLFSDTSSTVSLVFEGSLDRVTVSWVLAY